MENIINIDIDNPEISYVTNNDTQTDTILIKFENTKTGAKLALYKKEKFVEEIDMVSPYELADIYLKDGSVTHIRYTDAEKQWDMHICGNSNLYSDMVVKKITAAVWRISGREIFSVTPDYMRLLAALISSVTAKKAKSCYNDLNKYREEIILQLQRLGLQADGNATIEEMAQTISNLHMNSGYEILDVIEITDMLPSKRTGVELINIYDYTKEG